MMRITTKVFCTLILLAVALFLKMTSVDAADNKCKKYASSNRAIKVVPKGEGQVGGVIAPLCQI